MSGIENMLLELEDRCRMRINAPLGVYRGVVSPDRMRGLSELYKISNGIEINVPGTVIYPAEEVREYCDSDHGESVLEIGSMNFGDILVMDEDGIVQQIDHESGEVFLTWNTIEGLLMDELETTGI